LEESEEQTKNVLEDDYVHYLDALPEIKTFMKEVWAKEALEEEEKAKEEAQELFLEEDEEKAR